MSDAQTVQASIRGIDGSEKGPIDLPAIFGERPRDQTAGTALRVAATRNQSSALQHAQVL